MALKIIPIISTWLLVVLFKISAGQEPLTIDSRLSNLSRNPALAGIQVEDITLDMNFRHQVRNILVPYRILQVQIESRFDYKESNNGFTAGAIIRYEEAGENNLKRAQFIPVLNFHKSLSDIKISYLNMGFMIGIYKSQFDLNKLPNFQNFQPIPFDPTHPIEQSIPSNSNSYIDFSTGISWNTENDQGLHIALGAALFHFCQNSLNLQQSIPKTPRQWVLNSGLNFIQKKYSLQMIADLRLTKTDIKFNSLIVGGLVINRNFINQTSEIQLGFSFRAENEFDLLVALKCTSVFVSFCYNMGATGNKNVPFVQNAFESNFSINLNCHKRKLESEKLKCFF